MGLYDKIEQLLSRRDQLLNKNPKPLGIEHINDAIEIEAIGEEINYIFQKIADSVDSNELNNALLKEEASTQTQDSSYFFSSSYLRVRGHMIKDKPGVTAEERQKISSYLTSGPEETGKALEFFNDIANRVLDKEELEKYNNYNLVKGLSALKIHSEKDTLLKVIKNILPTDKELKIEKETENFVATCYQKIEDVSHPFNEQYIPDLEKKATTQEQIDAINYIKENTLEANEKYSNFLSGMQNTIMGESQHIDKKMADEFVKKNPQYKNLYVQKKDGTTECFVCNDSTKQKIYEDTFNAEYKLSENTSNTIATLMHKLDDLNMINSKNIREFEEGDPKLYALRALNPVKNALDKAMQEGKVEKLPKLVNDYKEIKAKYDEMLQICKDNFAHNPYHYGSNVDVARNKYMPLEYRLNSEGVSQLSNLYIALKFCKLNNIDIDDFSKRPNFYMSGAQQQLAEKWDLEGVKNEKGLGAALYLINNVPDVASLGEFGNISGLIGRADASFKCFDPNPKNLEYNNFLTLFNSENRVKNIAPFVISFVKSKNMDETVQNMALFGNNKSIYQCSANPKATFDYVNHKNYNVIKPEEYIKDNNLDYKQIYRNVKDLYEGSLKYNLTVGKGFDKKYIDGLKKMVNSIKENKNDCNENKYFNRLDKYVSNLKEIPLSKDVNALLGKEINKDTKIGLMGHYLTQERIDYANLPLSTRLVSYLPFVNNKATMLRNSINLTKDLLMEKGVSKENIDKMFENDDKFTFEKQTEIDFDPKSLKEPFNNENLFDKAVEGINVDSIDKEIEQEKEMEKDNQVIEEKEAKSDQEDGIELE